MRKSILTLITLFLFTLLSVPSFAAWHLDNNYSLLNFVSIKKGTVAENHRFNKLEGKVDESGKVEIKVDLASVDTNIAIRDERMKKFVFETQQYASAVFSAQLDNNLLKTLNAGDSKTASINGTLSFHGYSQDISFDITVSKLTTDKLLVTTLEPFFIKADAFGVVNGINKLKELASLPSIDYVVPVSFSVTFTR